MMNSTSSSVELLLDASVKREIRVPILTTRLELRPFEDWDTDSIAALLADREVTKYIGDVRSREDAATSVKVMRKAFLERGWGTLAVTLRGRANAIGYCGVRPLAHTAELEIAFALQRDCWNLGYATEAAYASVDAAFSTLGIDSIVATVYPQNQPSLRVLEKLRMKLDSKVFGHWPMSAALLFRVHRNEWCKRS
jgi:RimJ/RimL family protein N-acetyltransferase